MLEFTIYEEIFLPNIPAFLAHKTVKKLLKLAIRDFLTSFPQALGSKVTTI